MILVCIDTHFQSFFEFDGAFLYFTFYVRIIMLLMTFSLHSLTGKSAKNNIKAKLFEKLYNSINKLMLNFIAQPFTPAP